MSTHREHIDHEDLVHRYYFDALSAQEEAQLLRLVKSDPEVAQLFKEYSVVKQLAPKPEIGYEAAFAKFNAVNKPQSKSRLVIFASIAAVASVLLFMALPFINTPSGADHLLVASNDSVRSATLPDHSLVAMNKHTTLRSRADFAENRTVEMTAGEAHFEVATDSTSPFIVETPFAQVRVLGTGFNIKIDTINKMVHVAVLHGCVSVKNAAGDSVILAKGQKAGVFSAADSAITTSQCTLNEVSWETQQLKFASSPMPAVIDALNLHFGSRLELAGGALDSCRLNANFDKPNLQEVLQMLNVAFDITIDTTGSRLIVRGPGC